MTEYATHGEYINKSFYWLIKTNGIWDHDGYQQAKFEAAISDMFRNHIFRRARIGKIRMKGKA